MYDWTQQCHPLALATEQLDEASGRRSSKPSPWLFQPSLVSPDEPWIDVGEFILLPHRQQLSLPEI